MCCDKCQDCAWHGAGNAHVCTRVHVCVQYRVAQLIECHGLVLFICSVASCMLCPVALMVLCCGVVAQCQCCPAVMCV